jgi:acyl-CoA synthetase (AMP-forming)/AMP-acid ligase II
MKPLDFLLKGAGQWSQTEALNTKDEAFTFEELRSRVFKLTGFLKNRGLTPGTPVSLYIEDYSMFFTAIFSVWAVGGVVIPMNLSLPLEIRFKIEQKAGALIGLVNGPTLTTGYSEIRYIDLKEFKNQGESDNSIHYEAREDDTAMIMFTSGTTGMTKAIPCSHKMLALNASLMSDVLKLTHKDKIFINTPPYYTSAISHLLTCYANGAGIAARAGFYFGTDILREMDNLDCTGLGGVPTHMIRIVETAGPNERTEKLRFFMSSGDHLPEHVIEKSLELFPDVKIYTVYGLSEVGGRLCSLTPEFLPDKNGSVGKPLPGMTVTVRREDFSEAGTGETGEVYIEGPLVMDGYMDDEKSNKELLSPLGFRTGDFGYKDEDGFLYLEGRKDDIFKSGSEKVSTILIQKALQRRKEFSDVAVAPVKDSLMGNVAVAYYVMREGKSFERKPVVKYLVSVLPSSHMPKKFIEVDEIPRTGSGKVKRKELIKI